LIEANRNVPCRRHCGEEKYFSGVNTLFEYRISSSDVNPYAAPLFHGDDVNFGSFISKHFEFPKDYEIDKLSDDLIIDMDVAENGVENIVVIKSINEQIDSQIIKILQSSSKHWKPLKINNQIFRRTLRLHYLFYLGEE
jgi:hypothetical protein